jgi:hypothetical protein
MLLGTAKLYPWPVLQKITVMMNNLLAIITIDLDPHFQMLVTAFFSEWKSTTNEENSLKKLCKNRFLKGNGTLEHYCSLFLQY